MLLHARTQGRRAGLAAALCGLVVLPALGSPAAASTPDDDQAAAPRLGVLDAQPACSSDPLPPAPPWDDDTVHALPATRSTRVAAPPAIAFVPAGVFAPLARAERLSFAPKTSPPR